MVLRLECLIIWRLGCGAGVRGEPNRPHWHQCGWEGLGPAGEMRQRMLCWAQLEWWRWRAAALCHRRSHCCWLRVHWSLQPGIGYIDNKHLHLQLFIKQKSITLYVYTYACNVFFVVVNMYIE